MAARSIATLSLSFGLVSIPVKVYSATESSSSVSFNLLHSCGSRLKQQYVCIKEGVVVERADMVKGYEFDKDRYVTFTAAELKALEESARHTIDIISFIPLSAVDPIYYDKAYYLAPDKRGGKPYGLLIEAMRESGRCALARWVWKGKQLVVQVRPGAEGLILQQLLYADEVRSMKELDIERADITKPELQLALQLIDQISADSYDAADYKDDEKQRVLAAIDEKIAGKDIVVADPQAEPAGGQIIDLTEALRASLRKPATKGAAATAGATETTKPAAPATSEPKERKAAKRAGAAAGTSAEPVPVAEPARARARK
ncbi:MAG: DNA repair protein [Methylibium sp. NZG]|nr:MAG: DNA repair protein [Methylibium sp. NZG]